MKRLFLLVVFLAVSIQVDAAKMSSYTDNTTPNSDVYFIGVDPNDTTQTVNGSNYRYSLGSILGLGLLDAVFNSLSVTGSGDSWLELNNNSSFSGSLVGKYGYSFLSENPTAIINGTTARLALYSELLGGGAPTIQEADPTLADPTGWYAAQTSGDIFYVNHGVEMFAVAGTRTADETVPVIVAGADGTHDGSTPVTATMTLTELYPDPATLLYTVTGGTPASGTWIGTYPNYSVEITPTGTDPIVVTSSGSDLADNPAIGTRLEQTFTYSGGASYDDVILHLNADGVVASTTYTIDATEIGPATGTVGSLASVSTGSALIGVNGFTFPTTGDSFTFLQSIDAGKFQLAYRIKIPTAWTSLTAGDFVTVRNSDDSRYCTVRPYNDGDTNEFQLSYRENGGSIRTISTDAANLAADTEYIVLVEVDDATPTIKLSVYSTAYALLDSVEYTTAFTAPTGNFDRLYLYVGTSISTGLYIDNVMLSDLSNARNFITDTISGTRMVDRNDAP